jgi:SAM-dependent methyltransferase
VKQIEAHWQRASHLVTRTRDLIDERPGAEPPSWVVARSWVPFLSHLSDADLARCEADGLAMHAAALGAPADLVHLAAEVQAVCALRRLAGPGGQAPTHRVTERKRQQVAAFAAAVAPRAASAARVVDVGAGHGHLTRHLAEALQIEALGLERDPALVATARALNAPAQFEAVDLFADPPAFRADDLVVGLHACGELSDRLVQHAAEAGAAVAYASCCLHKRTDAARMPLVPPPELATSTLCLPRGVLGLGNIALGRFGVEATLAENLAARRKRAAVVALLALRGLEIPPGSELRGVNRRRAQAPLPELVARVLEVRGLAPATPSELHEAERRGTEAHAQHRRWSVARRMLGRVVEIYVNLDRAYFLVQRGYHAHIGTLWPAEASPRNVGVVAYR